MLCERCKIREANIQYTEVINGIRTEHNLCAQCARELDFGPYSAIFDGDMPLGRLLSGLLGLEETTQEEDKMKTVVCRNCQLSYGEFVESSCFGCPDCYGVFDLLVSDSIKQLQGSDTHCGKKPKLHTTAEVKHTDGKLTDALDEETPQTAKEQLGLLEAKLKAALRQEEYEQAAVYRDEIRKIKGDCDHA